MLPVWVALVASSWVSSGGLAAQEGGLEPENVPRITWKSPPSGLSLVAPAGLPLIAEVSGIEQGDVAVEFVDGDSSLGWVDSPFSLLPGLDSDAGISASGIYTFEWSEISSGTHSLAAVLWLDGEELVRSETSDIEVASVPSQPEVSLRVVEPIALEGGGTGENTAVLLLERSGALDLPLEVFIEWEGIAEPNEDFVPPSSSIVIAAGEATAAIEILALNDALVEGDERLLVRVLPPFCIDVFPPAEDCYLVGRNGEAGVTIRDAAAGVENQSPFVALLEPLAGQVFREGDSVELRAHAWDLDGDVRAIEFLEGDRVLERVALEPDSNSGEGAAPVNGEPGIPLPPTPRLGQFLWENVSAGRFVLTARAIDDAGSETDSAAVQISVASTIAPSVVSIEAVDDEAHEAGVGRPGRPIVLDGGRFEVRRSGDVSQPLVVGLSIGGSATNGRDYRRIRERFTIPAGRRSASIEVVPMNDREAEGVETVLVELQASDCGEDQARRNRCYVVGRSSRAQLVIQDDERTNLPLPPSVEIVRPRTGSEFKDSQSITLFASADDRDGRVVSVEFFANGESLGSVRSPGNGRSQLRLFRFNAGRLAPGRYEIGALATDDDRNTTRSESVTISVGLDLVRPVISVRALDPVGAEVAQRDQVDTGSRPGAARALRNTASFLITRTGLQDVALTIPYRMTGTAENGNDYSELSGAVELPAGVSRALVVVHPIDDSDVEGREDVVLELLPVPCLAIFPPPRNCYTFGRSSSARVVIHDNDRAGNLPPELDIVAPENGAEFDRPRAIGIQVKAVDRDGVLEEVSFFANNRLLGTVEADSNATVGEVQEFHFDWLGPAPGRYSIEARARDAEGQVSRSKAVSVTVIESVLPQTQVTVEAIDPTAAEMSEGMPSDAGIFRFRRSGDLSVPVEVSYRIGGNAVNGSDYERVPRRFVFEADEDSVDLPIRPVDDTRVEGTEFVEVALLEPACIAIFPPPPACYKIGEQGRASVRILDNDRNRNLAPKVAIIEPKNRTVFHQPEDIAVRIEARDRDGWIGYAALFAGEEQVAEQTLNFFREPDPGQRQHFEMVWNSAPVGTHQLTAVVVDDQGERVRSRPVTVAVRGEGDVPVVTVFARDGFASEPDGNRPANRASFRIRRTGSTESELEVYYELSGLAVNGQDYEELSGIVTIPARKRWVALDVVPLADGQDERVESVLVNLVDGEPAGGRATYSVGRPGRAGIVIGSRGQSSGGSRRLDDGSVHVLIPVPNGQSFRIESSTVLGQWDVIGANTATEGAIHIVDAESSGTEARFFRLIPDVDSDEEEESTD